MKKPDDWAWMVLMGAFMVHVLSDGIVYSFGVMVVEFLDSFQEGRLWTAWIVSLMTGLSQGAGPIASAITIKFGCRTTVILGSLIATSACLLSFFANSALYLMISLGVLLGFGHCLIDNPAILMVTFYFEANRGLATGLALCGAGFGAFMFAPFTSYLIGKYSWRGALLIDAGLLLNCAVFGSLFKPVKRRTKAEKTGPSSLDTSRPQSTSTIFRQQLKLLKDPIFLTFASSCFLTNIGYSVPLIFLPDKAHNQLAVSKDAAAWTLSAFGIFNTIGRVLVGWLGDRTFPCVKWGKNQKSNRLTIYVISLVFCGTITSLSLLCTNLQSLIVYSAMYGFFLSSKTCLTSVILVDLLGIEKMTNTYGVLLLFQGVSSIMGPPMAGWIVDSTKSYDLCFVFAGVNVGISGLMLVLLPVLQARIRTNMADENSHGLDQGIIMKPVQYNTSKSIEYK